MTNSIVSNDKDENVIKTVKRVIGETNLTTAEIADKIGASVKSVNRWFQGKCTPNLKYFIRILDLNIIRATSNRCP